MTAQLARLDWSEGAGGAVARVALDRPGRANSLVAELVDDLRRALDAVEARAPAAMVLTGAGAHFSTGGDVARFLEEARAGRGRAYADRVVGGLHEAMLRLMALPAPVIAAARGAATGGAVGLILAADLVAMADDAFLQPYYATVGFAPDGGWTALLPERIGTGRTLSALMLNRRIAAEEALALGLATATAPAAQLDALVAGWLDALAGHKAGTLRAAKRLVRDAARIDVARRRLDAERVAFLDLIDGAEARAGMAAFLGAAPGRAQT